MNGISSAQRAYDSFRPSDYFSTEADAASEARAEKQAKLTAAEQFLRVCQGGHSEVTLPTSGTVPQLSICTLLTYLSEDCARLLLKACAQALKPGASIGTAERFAEDRAVADLLRTFMAEMAAEYANDNVGAWL